MYSLHYWVQEIALNDSLQLLSSDPQRAGRLRLAWASDLGHLLISPRHCTLNGQAVKALTYNGWLLRKREVWVNLHQLSWLLQKSFRPRFSKEGVGDTWRPLCRHTHQLCVSQHPETSQHFPLLGPCFIKSRDTAQILLEILCREVAAKDPRF